MTTKLDMWLPNPITLPDEHRIFQATEETIRWARSIPLMHDPRVQEFGAWAIADNSGDTPDQTDDGTLFLDFSRNVLLGTTTGNSPHIPLMDKDGKKQSAVTNTASLLILSDMFRWTINVNGKLYRTIRW